MHAFNATQCIVILFNEMRFNAIQCNAIKNTAMQYYAIGA